MQVEKTEIYLIRHGQVDFPQGVFYGQLDIPLSDIGKRQSLLCAKRFTDIRIDAVISSDLSRCLYLSNKIAEVHNIDLFSDKRLREINFGKWQGLSWDEIESLYPGQMEKRMKNLASFRPPLGESLTDLLNRAFPVLEDCLNGKFGERIVIVAHGGVNRALICKLLGMDLQNLFCLQQDYTCINLIDSYLDGQRVLRYINCTCHLTGL